MKTRRRWTLLIAILAVFGLVASACSDDSDDTSDGGGESADGSDFTACMVSDAGGFDDKSFNQTAFAGMTVAEDELGISTKSAESQNESDYAPNIDQFVEEGCDLIITVGFLLGDATAAAAEANPDQKFAIVDFAYEEEYANIDQLVFATNEAAFLAGYVAAGTTETGTLGTYGGINIPTVSTFMEGFEYGMDLYNEENGGAVELLGWSNADGDGQFTGDFENQDNGRNVTETFLDEGADIIMPVAGPVGLGTTAAVADNGSGGVVWVDTDGCVSAEQDCDLFVTSVMKNMDTAVLQSIERAVNGEFAGGIVAGTLSNDGVGIAPYHEWEDKVPSEVQDRVEEIRQEIIDGTVSVSG